MLPLSSRKMFEWVWKSKKRYISIFRRWRRRRQLSMKYDCNLNSNLNWPLLSCVRVCAAEAQYELVNIWLPILVYCDALKPIITTSYKSKFVAVMLFRDINMLDAPCLMRMSYLDMCGVSTHIERVYLTFCCTVRFGMALHIVRRRASHHKCLFT